MARFRRGCALALSLTLLSAMARAEDRPSDAAPRLYDRPVLVVDPGLHTATIRSVSADAAGRWAVTGSEDRTVRIWSVADGVNADRDAHDLASAIINTQEGLYSHVDAQALLDKDASRAVSYADCRLCAPRWNAAVATTSR